MHNGNKKKDLHKKNLQGSFRNRNTLGRIILVEARNEGGERGGIRFVQAVPVHPAQPEAENKQKYKA